MTSAGRSPTKVIFRNLRESADIVLLGDRLGGVMDTHEIARVSYAKTRQNLLGAFSFNGIGVAAATTGLVHPVFAMLAMIASVSAVLANSFAGQLLAGEGITTDFSVEDAGDEEPSVPEKMEETDGVDEKPADEKPARQTVTFDVDLHCGSCEDRVVATLDELDGVREVRADAGQQWVEVTFNPHRVDADELQQTIDELGYAVGVVESPTPDAD